MWESRRKFLYSATAVLFWSNEGVTMPVQNSKTLRATYMWRTVGSAGLERGELHQGEQHWIMSGTILRASNGGPAEVRYKIICDAQWRTKSAKVCCQDDLSTRELQVTREDGGWYVNQKRLELPGDCTDIDLAWSPSTNTLPIRRLALKIGAQSGPLTAAWVRLPALTIEPLPQTYERMGPHAYIYRSRGRSFKASLTVDEDSLVVDYEGAWERIGKTKMGDN
jgi:uncharacterized protein